MNYPDPADTVVTITPEARETIAAMHERVETIGTRFGDDSPEYVKAATSLNWALTSALGRGVGKNVRISRDGQLSLFVQEDGGYCYGIIFFRDHGAAERMLTRHNIGPDHPEREYILGSFENLAGDWSTHS